MTNQVNQKRHEWSHQRTRWSSGRRIIENLPLRSRIHDQQQTSDSRDPHFPHHHYHQVCCSQERQDLCCPRLENLREKTCIVERDEDEHSIWRKNSGQGGVKNICSSYRQETSGFDHKEISRLEMSSC